MVAITEDVFNLLNFFIPSLGRLKTFIRIEKIKIINNGKEEWYLKTRVIIMASYSFKIPAFIMKNNISRRNFLKGMLTGTVVVGFDTIFRTWITPAELLSASLPAPDFPTFEGDLLVDETSLEIAADDFGHIVHRSPIAVLRPGSVNDIVRLIRFACKYKIKVAARGQGYSSGGQGQVEAGVVIDMTPLNKILEINSTDVLVEGGISWLNLLQQTVPFGLTLPTLVDILEITIGGTIPVGGIDGHAFRYGPLSDNILELYIVTGRGDLVSCSSKKNRTLFDACRAGLGQFGIIVGARLRLIYTKPKARSYTLPYTDVSTMMSDQELLIEDGRFDFVDGEALPDGYGGWFFLLEVAKYFIPGDDEPDDDSLLTDLSFIPGGQVIEDMDYFDFANRWSQLIEEFKQMGIWYFPHPGIALLLPATRADEFISNALESLYTDEEPAVNIKIYPLNSSKFRTPFFTVPSEQHFFAFFLVHIAIPPTPENTQALINANQLLFKQAVSLGGKRYPIDSVIMNKHDWQHHFQPKWGYFVSTKHHFDPSNILTPGQCIFYKGWKFKKVKRLKRNLIKTHIANETKLKYKK